MKQIDLEAELINRYRCSKLNASIMANDLCNLAAPQHRDINAALEVWLQAENREINVSEGAFNTEMLTEAGLTYPAALAFIDWVRSDPGQIATMISHESRKSVGGTRRMLDQ